MSEPAARENIMNLGDRLLWGMANYGVGSELFGATAYVGFNTTLDVKINYFLCDGTADDVQINAAEAYVTALGGGSVVLEGGTYDIVDPIIPTGNDIWFRGQGRNTFLDGDGLATTEHVFHVTARDDFRVSDMSMQTEDGGAKTCHCIFIENGSDRFHIENITVIDSDDDGFHIEGTDIIGGKILNNTILSCDGEGIFIDMDGGNTIVALEIKDNFIGNSSANGMLLSEVHDSQITDNIVVDSVSDGVELLADCDDNMITDNILNDNGAYGINIAAATCNANHVLDNVFHGNVTNGVSDSGTGTGFNSQQYYVARDDDNIGAVPGKSITNGQTAYIAVHAPQGMHQIMGFNIYVIPNATQANADWDLETDYGANGEAYNTHEEAEAAATYNVTDNQWFALDAFAAGMFASLAEEDTGGISLTVSGVGHNVTVVMAELYFV